MAVAKGEPKTGETSEKKESLFHILSDETAVLTLAFVGGYVDAAGYIKLDGLFTSSITGNLVAACAGVFRREGILARAIVSIAFTFAGAIAVILILRLKLVHNWSKKSLAMLVFSLEALFLIAAIPTGLVNEHSIDADGALYRWPLIVVGAILGGAMGLHNAAAKEYIPNCPATTVMTMTLVSVSIGWAQMCVYSAAHHLGLRLVPAGTAPPADYEQQMLLKCDSSVAHFNKAVKPLIAFLVGAIVAAVITVYGSFWSLLVPVALICWLLLDIYLSTLPLHTAPASADVEQASKLLAPAPAPPSEESLYQLVELPATDNNERTIEIEDPEQAPAGPPL